MPDRTQEIKNLRAVALASKNYIDKRIDDLQWQLGTYDLSVESDNTSALVKTMPSGTIKLNVNKIYGDSEVSENLAVLTDTAQTTDRGVTYSISNGTINVGDSATSNLTIMLSSLTYFNGTYTFKNFGSQVLSNSVYFVFLLDGQWTTVVTVKSDSEIITLSGNYVYGIAITSGTSVSGTIKPMLVSGSTAPSEFKVGFANIHNLELTGIRSESQNVFPNNSFTDATNQGITATKQSDGTIKLNGTATGYPNFSMGNIELEAGTYYLPAISISLYYWIGTTSGGRELLDKQSYQRWSFTLTQRTIVYFSFTIVQNASLNFIFKPTCIRGKSDITTDDYTPYETPTTKTIDLSTIVDSNNNKLFPNGKLMGNANVKDVLGVYNQESKWDEVDLGSLNWGAVSIGNDKYRMYSGGLASLIKSISTSTVGNLLCVKYDAKTSLQTYSEQVGISTNDGGIYVYDTNYNQSDSATSFKTAMSGVMLQFERNTYLTSNTDLSATLRNIQGYSNGSIIAENTYGMDTTSEIDYLVEEVKA